MGGSIWLSPINYQSAKVRGAVTGDACVPFLDCVLSKLVL